jgi:integral membrane protein
MTACLTRRQLTCFGTLFHVKHSDDVTSDDFYMTPDNISDDTRASNAAHDHSMAYIVGTLLVVLVCVAMPLKYAAGTRTMVNVVGISHGWLYPILLITAYLLGRKAGWPLTRLLIIALAGTVPFLSFVAEYFAHKDVNRRIDDAKNYWAHHGAPTE